MLVATQAIVLNTVKFQESSLIVKLLTKSHGAQTFMVKGIRSKRANGKAAMFQSGMLLEIIMYYQEQKSFKTLKEYKAAHVYISAFYDIRKSSVLMFLIELLAQCVHPDNEDEVLFDFVFESLQNFDQNAFSANFHLNFIMELMRILGIYPSGKFSLNTQFFDIKEGSFIANRYSHQFVCNARSSELLGKMLQEDQLNFNKLERKQMLHLLLRYFEFHQENFRGIKSLKVLETVLS